MTDTKTMTAPVSLADVRLAREGIIPSALPPLARVIVDATPALVELAEAYLEWRHFDKRPKGMGFGGEELQLAHERLALAAKGVRP